MLRISCPLTRPAEREYICRVLFEEFLGIHYLIEFKDRNDIEITLSGGSEHRLVLADVLLSKSEAEWLKPASLPARPLSRLEVEGMETRLPVIYGHGELPLQQLRLEQPIIHCSLDLFGSCFFMLTRYEEVVSQERDHHDRFPSVQCLAYQEGFLDEPIVNRYTELLWRMLESLWPGLDRKPRASRKLISHDVDYPFFAMRRSNLSIAKESLGDVLKRRQLEAAVRKARMIGSGVATLERDPFNTFDWIMGLSEQAGLRSSFYFITEQTEPGVDGNYAMDDPEIHDLMIQIHERGHEIGLHPSYRTYLSPQQIRREFHLLRQQAELAGIHQEQWGGRQHFLRWQAPDTWQGWEDAGLQYDSTLGCADRPGFRCGTCYEYPVFNLRTGQSLKLRERPLIVMELTVLETPHITEEEAFATIGRYYWECVKYAGDFTLLWHNSRLVRTLDRKVYQRCIEELK